jgi:acyl carrier protein
MYWFSPGPCPVEWYEYFYLVMLTVLFSSLMNVTAEPLMAIIVSFFRELVMESDEEDLAVEDFDWTLDQCGLSSVGLPQLALRIRNAMSTATSPISISASQLSDAQTVGDICEAIKKAILQANADGI